MYQLGRNLIYLLLNPFTLFLKKFTYFVGLFLFSYSQFSDGIVRDWAVKVLIVYEFVNKYLLIKVRIKDNKRRKLFLQNDSDF